MRNQPKIGEKSVKVVAPPYIQPKIQSVLNDYDWLETHFKHVFENCNKDQS